MYRWARFSEAMSDQFTLFCTQNGVVDRHNNLNRYWEYPWAFYQAKPRPGMSVLDVGTGYSAFPTYLWNEGLDIDIHALDPAFFTQKPIHLPMAKVVSGRAEALPYSDKVFDVIFCLSVLEHLAKDIQRKSFEEFSRVLRPGGKLIITIDYFINWPAWKAWQYATKRSWLADCNIDLKQLISNSKLIPFSKKKCDPIPSDSRIDNAWLDSSDFIKSDHIAKNLFVTAIGAVLFKPYSVDDLAQCEFRLVRSWLRRLPDNQRIILEHIGLNSDCQFRRFWLPDELLLPKPLLGSEICEAFGTQVEDGVSLVNELVCYGMLVEYKGTEIDNQYWQSVGDDSSFCVNYN